jgi:hypothetical protein
LALGAGDVGVAKDRITPTQKADIENNPIGAAIDRLFKR